MLHEGPHSMVEVHKTPKGKQPINRKLHRRVRLDWPSDGGKGLDIHEKD